MSSRILPPELIDNIIDHFHDDPVNLHSCALVNSAWLPASCYHIFRCVSIRIDKGTYPYNTSYSGDASRLYRIVLSSLEIIPFICDLLIYKGTKSPDQDLNWMTQEESLPLLLHLLTNLWRLKFKIVDRLIEHKLVQWYTHLIDSICMASCLPSIIELKLCGLLFDTWEQLLQMFHLFPALKVLHLEKILLVEEEEGKVDYIAYQYDEAEGGSDLVTTQHACLDVLSIASHSPAIIKILLHPRSFIDVMCICELNLVVQPVWLPNLLRSTPYLERLQFNFGYGESFLHLPCDIF